MEIAPESKLAQIIGGGDHAVNSFHGQAVGRIGQGLQVCATAEDGVIEAVERPDRRFVVGLQWHPEIISLTDSSALAVFQALVSHADQYRAARQVKRSGGVRESTGR